MLASDAADWVSAIATTLAVMVALFLDDITGWWRRPKLEVRAKLEPPDCVKTPMVFFNTLTGEPAKQCNAYYLRAFISNAGNRSARNVHVLAAGLERVLKDRSRRLVSEFQPMLLIWSGTKAPGQAPQAFVEQIAPGLGRHIDVAHVIDPATRSQVHPAFPENLKGKAFAELDVEQIPFTNSHLIGPGEYRLEIRVGCENAGAVSKFVTFSISGGWSEDEHEMYASHLGFGFGP